MHPVRIGQVAVPEAGGNAEHYGERCCRANNSTSSHSSAGALAKAWPRAAVSSTYGRRRPRATPPALTPSTRAAEARRLAHVAATRARRRHFVSHPAELISKRGYPYPVEPSRFLDDVLRRYGNTQVVRLEVPGAEPAAAAAPAPA